jgi:hypothetical protein
MLNRGREWICNVIEEKTKKRLKIDGRFKTSNNIFTSDDLNEVRVLDDSAVEFVRNTDAFRAYSLSSLLFN